MAIAWSSSDKDVIERQLTGKGANAHKANNEEEQLADDKIKEQFEIERCAAWIKRNCLQNVTLQFPDNLLQYAPKVASLLETELGGQRVAVLGDTSYGECCVDEVAAEHVGADSVIHFGDTCLSPTERLPVLYVYTQDASLDINDLFCQINQNILTKETDRISKKVAIFYAVQYDQVFRSSVISGILARYKIDVQTNEGISNIVVCHPHCKEDNGQDNFLQSIDSETKDQKDLQIQCGRLVPNSLVKQLDSNRSSEEFGKVDRYNWTIIYVGDSNIYAEYLSLTFPHTDHILYQARQKLLVPSGANVSRALMRRYFAIEKTKDAERIGILVGTLGVAKYCDIIDKCRDTIKRSGKRSYTFLVGKPNAAKLANFPEIDVFVIVACPLNSIELAVGNISEGRDRSGKDYFKPIITPFELDVALNPERKWTGGEFKANFRSILPGEKDYVEFKSKICGGDEEDETDVSLITGKLRISNTSAQNGLKEDSTGTESTALMTQERQVLSSAHARGGGQFLADRSWTGLEQRLGQDPPTIAVQGRVGIASSYVGEGEDDK